MTAQAEIVYLLVNGDGQFIGFTSADAEAEGGREVIEWPVKLLAPVGPSVAGLEYAHEVLSTDSAELGKLGSIDMLVQVRLLTAARYRWECYSALPGIFGQAAYPPAVTLLFKRKVGS